MSASKVVHNNTADSNLLDSIDRKIIVATQQGLPITAEPYAEIARTINISVSEVITRLCNMRENGIIRRVGLVPNHYALGYTSNGMTVWNVPDERASELGHAIGALPFVSHCYRRPRHMPNWPYNLFAMVHGRNRAETEEQIAAISRLLGQDDLGHAVLYSTRILKKTGLRLSSTA